jgi:preprotein translocase subunit SecG
VIYVLLAIGMIALILMQRGAGAQAGSGFGGGASATVFGSRGASNFLSKSTKWLAIVFFAISLFMAWYHTRNTGNAPAQQDLGVMAQQGAQAPADNSKVPAAPGSQIPSAPATVPQAPAQQQAQPQPQQPAPAQTPPATPQGG